jgi:DNA polymerase bacteriophage-type
MMKTKDIMKSNVLHLDYETKSRVDLKKVGLDRYVHDESTCVLMMAWAFGNEPVSLWLPHLSPMPDRLRRGLDDTTVEKHAWNAAFEIGVTESVLGIAVRVPEWHDSMAHARYLAFPGYLDQCGDVLGIGTEYQKSDEGKTLLKLFTMPTKAKKPTKKNPAGVPSVFNDWESHPQEWETFCEYCRQDVVAERAAEEAMDGRAKFPANEQRIWVFDQIVNRRGIPIDLNFCEKAFNLVECERAALIYEMKTITGCDNPNSPQQLKKWLAEEGWETSSTSKDLVTEVLKHDFLTPDARKALELKQLMGGIAFKKIPVVQRQTREDRLRAAFVYHAAHTGRWSSKGVQFHNLIKPSKRAGENNDAIVAAILNGTSMPLDEAGVQIPVVEAVTGTLRSMVLARPGNELFVADFSSIENRVLAWIADCPDLLKVFQHPTENDAYKAFAAKMYKIDYAAVTKQQRNFCKSPVLGCGFGMGAQRLVDYAKGMGQIITEEQAQELVYAWREAYPEIPQYWEDLGLACMKAVAKNQHLQFGPLRLDGRDPKMFHIMLPSGRQLNYEAPEIGTNQWGQNVLTHMVYEKYWKRIEARGSSLVENVVQAIARDLLTNAMFNTTDAGFDIVLHVHDELVAEVPIGSLAYEHFEHCMTTNPSWGLDIPLKVEGFHGERYRK